MTEELAMVGKIGEGMIDKDSIVESSLKRPLPPVEALVAV
jgi:hypothetical protein